MADGTQPRPRRRSPTGPTTLDPIEIAMEAEAANAAHDSPARRVLLKHERLIGWQIASERAGVALKVLTGLAGLAVAVALGAMAWQAHQYQGLVVTPFSVPPELEQRGLTGKVVAGKLLDALNTMQAGVNSMRAPNSYANNWADEVQVEIPQTGVSIGDLRRVLIDWLGRKTTIGGEVYRTPGGLVVAARTGVVPARLHAGPEPDLDSLITEAAEDVYAATQPYRYGVYLRAIGRQAEAEAHFQRMAIQGPDVERAWAYVGLSNSGVIRSGAERRGLAYTVRATQLAPDLYVPWSNMADRHRRLGHAAAAFAARSRAMRALAHIDRAGVIREQAPRSRLDDSAAQSRARGDFRAALAAASELARLGNFQGAGSGLALGMVRTRLGLHEVSAAPAALVAPELQLGGRPEYTDNDGIESRLEIAYEAQDWGGVLAQAALVPSLLAKWPGFDDDVHASFEPLIAYAMARTGDRAGAQALIAATPTDSYAGLMGRAKIAALAKDWPSVDRWFAEAVRQNPSIPFAYAEWGAALLAKGDPDAAIAKLTLAAKTGPRFADPLETWGEALAAKGDLDAAAARFAQAAQYAPNWGRLHLRWAQILARQGRTAQAREHRALAARLDVTPSERAELNGWRL